jgi:hypothetical protein
MSQENDQDEARERNPRFPSDTLRECVERIEKLFTGLGRGAAPAEALVKAMGYNSLSGASRTTLAALSYYGLLSRESNKYKVSDLALRIIRAVNPTDKVNAIWEACLAPKLFGEIQKDHADCSEAVLIPILIHKGFSQDGANRAARIFKDNLEFAGSLGYPPKENQGPETKETHSPAVNPMSLQAITANELPVPLGDNLVARVPFPMSEDDFNLLLGTLNLWKKKLIKPAGPTQETIFGNEPRKMASIATGR